MKGLRSYVAAIVGGVLSPWLVKTLGLEITPDQQLELVGWIMAGLMSVMRFISEGPDAIKQWLNRRRGDRFTPDQLQLLRNLFRTEIQSIKPWVIQIIQAEMAKDKGDS